MVSRRTRVASWIFRRDHPSRPKAMICSFFSSFKTFAMLREATYPPAAVNVLDDSSESMAAFQVFLYGRFWVFTEDYQQLLQYREDLENPPLLVVCDLDRFEIHTNFTGTVKRVYAFDLSGLAEPANLDTLRKLFTEPESLRPGQTTEGVTKQAAELIGQI